MLTQSSFPQLQTLSLRGCFLIREDLYITDSPGATAEVLAAVLTCQRETERKRNFFSRGIAKLFPAQRTSEHDRFSPRHITTRCSLKYNSIPCAGKSGAGLKNHVLTFKDTNTQVDKTNTETPCQMVFALFHFFPNCLSVP